MIFNSDRETIAQDWIAVGFPPFGGFGWLGFTFGSEL